MKLNAPYASRISGPGIALPAGRRERHRAEIRQRLFDEALRLFAQKGYFETTVEDITEAADVGKGTFFNYFPTKEHILAVYGGKRVAVVERALDQARATKGPVIDVLKELASNAVGQSNQNPGVIRAIYAAHASCAPVRLELQKRLQVSRRLLAKIIALAQKRGEIRRDLTPLELARVTQIVFMGMTMSWSMNPDSSLRKSSESVWNLLLFGLCAPKEAKGS
jgi:AcrR family transcriptional regulator